MKCKRCNKPTKNPKYCSLSCAASINGREYPKRKHNNHCNNCGKRCKTGTQVCCSNKCHKDFKSKAIIESWINGGFDGLSGYNLCRTIRNYLLKKRGYRCERCGWSKKNPYTNNVPVEVHHIDGDYRNNTEDNLQILCPNCHAMTENFRRRGKGRRGRT